MTNYTFGFRMGSCQRMPPNGEYTHEFCIANVYSIDEDIAFAQFFITHGIPFKKAIYGHIPTRKNNDSLANYHVLYFLVTDETAAIL